MRKPGAVRSTGNVPYMRRSIMSREVFDRREFILSLIGGLSMTALDWSAFPRGARAQSGDTRYDAVIIGSGLGALSCAAAFARQGFKPIVIEQHDRPGGYATSFKRPGGFEFDVSLHSTVVGEREGVHNLIPGFPEITGVEFLPHPNLYRLIMPDYDIRVPQRDVDGYVAVLSGLFPEEKEGITALIEDMRGIRDDINKFSAAGGRVDMSTFPSTFPFLFKCYTKTWGAIVDAHIQNPKLKGIVSGLWGYYGLPPSKLASFYYAMPTIGYMEEGGYYPRGRSQTISNAFVKYIEERGGRVMLKTHVDAILVKDGAAYGVRTAAGEEITGRVVVSNANAFDTFRTMLHQEELLADYIARLERSSVSLSSFQVFLGLNTDLVGKTGITDTEIFADSGYDPERAYQSALNAEVGGGSFGLTLYDNLYKGYSPPGKNTLNILTLQGFDHWKQYERDYFDGKKEAYNAEKNRMADLLIQDVEARLLPGLSRAIEVKEIGTPLTNIRFTSNYRGAIYGFDQTLDNSGPSRIPNKTPITNLYLAGAWTNPGHGYGGVIYSGLICFSEIMKNW
jgi:all-trans-retinol 13,14-reductase